MMDSVALAVSDFPTLSEWAQTTNQQLLVSVLAVGLVVAVLLTYRRLQAWLTERVKPLYSDIISTSLLILTCLISFTVVIEVWDQTAQVQSAYEFLDLSGPALAQSIVTFILLVGTYIFTRFVTRLFDELLTSASAVTDHQQEVTRRLTQVLIWSVSLVIVLGIWVDDLGGLLVGAGFFGIVVGMAARQTLGTILAGFILMFSRPFEIGDWIEIEDEEGIVTDISIINTRIRSFDGEYIMVPNDLVASSMVTNRSRHGRLRVEVDVGVDYETDVEQAATLAKEAVEELDRSLTAPAPQVVTQSFGDSAVVLGVRFWIDKPSARRFTRARTEAIGVIKAAFEDEGVTIPYPQRELSARAERGTLEFTDTDATAETVTETETTDSQTQPPPERE